MTSHSFSICDVRRPGLTPHLTELTQLVCASTISHFLVEHRIPTRIVIWRVRSWSEGSEEARDLLAVVDDAAGTGIVVRGRTAHTVATAREAFALLQVDVTH